MDERNDRSVQERRIDQSSIPSPAERIGKMVFDVTKVDPDKEVRWRFTAGPEDGWEPM